VHRAVKMVVWPVAQRMVQTSAAPHSGLETGQPQDQNMKFNRII